MKTLLLDQTAWDLVLDANGNIAVAEAPYQIAQDVASAVKLFQGECYYDTSQGVPYWQSLLGQFPPRGAIESAIETAALTVPGVVAAQCTITGVVNRKLSGVIAVTDTTGTNLSFPL